MANSNYIKHASEELRTKRNQGVRATLEFQLLFQVLCGMKPVDIEEVRSFLDRRAKQHQNLLKKRFNRAQRDFNKIIRIIINKYDPLRIYQWGSLLHPENFSEISDIDIAVEGIASTEQFFSLLSEADELTNFPLDMIELEKIHPLHAESIRKKGRLVYERS